MHPDHPPRFYERSRLRWINGIGFAISVCVAAWLLIALFGLATGARAKNVTPPPPLYLAVAGASLLALLGTFGYVLTFFGRGANMGHRGPRVALYIWSLAGTLCFAVLGLILLKFSSPGLPQVPVWSMRILWFLTVPGLVVFAALCYVNADLPADEDFDADYDEAYEDGYDEDEDTY